MKNNKKILIITIVSIVGLVIGCIIWAALGKSFLYYEFDRFMDYYCTLDVADNVYSAIGPGRGYFPFAYVIVNIIKCLIPHTFISYFLSFLLFIIILLAFYFILFKNLKSDVLVSIAIIVFTILAYPIIFDFDRANIEYLVFAFILLFFIFYKKEKYKLAALFLAFPICMKLYPTLFAILFLKDKKYKEFIFCGIISVLLMIASFFIIGGTIENLPVALDNFSFFTNRYSKTVMGVQFSHTIWSGLNYLSLLINNTLIQSSYMTIYTIIIAIVSLALIYYLLFVEKEKWKIITILTIMMITFPHVSFDYTLMHMYIPIAFFIISKNTKKWEEIVYSILFGITVIPMNWLQTINYGITLNLGLIIRPIVLISIILLIVITTIYKIIKERKYNKELVGN